jgi:HD-GYP domain-containing protein (c-di-GMP phosphodiesterase class II)
VGQLHDVGKLALPDAVLSKKFSLDADEWKIVYQHPRYGYEILAQAHGDLAALAAKVALQHHEHWDGSGYPEGLKGDFVCREARIVGLCDIYSAMREARTYKPSLTHEYVLHALLDGDDEGRIKPTMFDPVLLDVLEKHGEVFRARFDQLVD